MPDANASSANFNACASAIDVERRAGRHRRCHGEQQTCPSLLGSSMSGVSRLWPFKLRCFKLQGYLAGPGYQERGGEGVRATVL